MGRSTRGGGRRYPPNVPKVERAELSEANITLRLLAVGVAIVIAAVSFGYVVNNFVKVQTGWQTITAARSETGCTTQLVLAYNVGSGTTDAATELRAVSAHYGEAADEAYRALSNVEVENYHNLFYVNAHPNEQVQVHPLLYTVLSAALEADSRVLYYAPLYEQYYSLFGCDTDSQAEVYDPKLSPDAAAFTEEAARFAENAAMVCLELLGDGFVRLNIAPEYLAFAQENEITSFVDFGFTMNAFLVDAIADSLIDLGYTHGALSSFDGFIRALGAEEFAVNLYEKTEKAARQTASVVYTGPMALVSCHSFPMSQMDSSRFYTYETGEIRVPYLSGSGLLQAAGENLLVLNAGSCGSLAMQVYPVFAEGTAIPGDWNCVRTNSGNVESQGTGFAVRPLV